MSRRQVALWLTEEEISAIRAWADAEGIGSLPLGTIARLLLDRGRRELMGRLLDMAPTVTPAEAPARSRAPRRAPRASGRRRAR